MPAFDLHIVFDCADPDRLVGLGAGVAERFDEPDGFHILMRDPEGNEFCLA